MTEKEELMLDTSDSMTPTDYSCFLKGMDNAGWGMKNRLSRIFNPKTGRTVMLAFDHGSIMATTTGIDSLSASIVPLIHFSDSIICTRGVVRSIVPVSSRKPVCLRFSAGSTELSELNNDSLIDITEALRLNASAIAVTVALGDKQEARMIANLSAAVDAGNKYDIPVMAVVPINHQERDAAYYAMFARVCAENGASIIKTYYTEKNFARVMNNCPVPVIVAGGKKMTEQKALETYCRAISEGAAGIDVGRNVFQSSSPVAMIRSISGIVHDSLFPDDAFRMFRELSGS